jgi:hypothetical protein
VCRFDGSAATVAKLLANSGFKSAYAIKGGAEGQNGWRVRPVEILILLVILECIFVGIVIVLYQFLNSRKASR